MRQTFLTSSEQDTADLACRLGSELRPGAWILLRGDLGAGKDRIHSGDCPRPWHRS